MSSRGRRIHELGPRLLCPVLVGLGLMAAEDVAWACGCFAQPSIVSEPTVQAGERIVFALDEGKVTAHIEIQYTGPAEDFAWLVPVPSVPEVGVGTEELFARLERDTAPQLSLRFTGGFCNRGCGLSLGGCGDDGFIPGVGPDFDDGRPDVVVTESSAGPYDFAVVRADSLDPMVRWLNENRYFVPEGSEDALAPYIRPGAFFLALKLSAGETTGSIRPVILEYEAEVASIPLTLTSIGAVPDMGVVVWILGAHRAVPLNYQEVELNEAYLVWDGTTTNYQEVVARAIDEAEGGHGFVTEFAGRLPWRELEGEFTDLAQGYDLSASSFVELHARLLEPPWPWAEVVPVLARLFPYPSAASEAGVGRDQYYATLPASLALYDPGRSVDLTSVTDALAERFVEPLLASARLFEGQTFTTRLFTVLSPQEMNLDPVFGFNPDLTFERVDRARSVDLETTCEDHPPQRLHFRDGRSYDVDFNIHAVRPAPGSGVPYASRILLPRLEGPSEVIVDNADLIAPPEMQGGCRLFGRGYYAGADTLVLFAIVLGGRWWGRRRARRPAGAR